MKNAMNNNEVRLYSNSITCPYRFNVVACNDWFSREFVYRIHEDRVVFKRPTLDSKTNPTRARRSGKSWVFYLSLPDQENRRLTIDDEDITEDEAILYRL